MIELKPLAKVAFVFVKQTIDRDTQKYISISEKRSEAGKRGGRPLKNNELEESNEKQKKQLLSEKSKKSNCPLNDNDNVNDNDISFLKKETKSDVVISDLENENSESPLDTLQAPKEQSGGRRKRFTIPTPEEVQAYCNERNNGISGQQFCDFYSSKGWKVGSQPMKDWKASVRTWEGKRRETTAPTSQVSPIATTPKRFYYDENEVEITY